MNYIAWIVFVAAAALEVCGDALIRQGLKKGGIVFMVAGFLLLGIYGFVVNMVKWDFSKLLGVYVAIFALVSILTSQFVFGEKIPTATWIGLAIIVAGGMVIQFVRRQVVKFHINKKEDDSDLDEVERGFRVDPRGVLVLVQEQGHREEYVLKAK